MSIENQKQTEAKFFSPEEKARTLFLERGGQRFKLWRSLVEESALNEKNKKHFNEILSRPFNPIQHGNVEGYLGGIVDDLWDACIYSYQTDEALAIYHNIKDDIEKFRRFLYSDSFLG